jgi:hypothetical protein
MVRDILAISTAMGSWDARLKIQRIHSKIEQCTV